MLSRTREGELKLCGPVAGSPLTEPESGFPSIRLFSFPSGSTRRYVLKKVSEIESHKGRKQTVALTTIDPRYKVPPVS